MSLETHQIQEENKFDLQNIFLLSHFPKIFYRTWYGELLTPPFAKHLNTEYQIYKYTTICTAYCDASYKYFIVKKKML